MSNYENMSALQGYSGYNVMPSPKDTRINDALVRGELEKDFNQRYLQLKNLYEMRIQTFQESIKNAFKLVQSDELIDTMKHDTASEDYVAQRVKEIIEECIFSDREALIDKLSQQYAYLKTEFSKVEQENNKVKTFLNSIDI